MTAGETPLQMAPRHVLEQESRIAKQQQIIERLSELGESTDLAEQVLETMERTLAITRSEVRRYSN
jgi:hypothetical protein